VNFLRRVGNLEASIVCWRKSERRVQLLSCIGGLRSAHSNGWPRAQSGGQIKKTPISSEPRL